MSSAQASAIFSTLQPAVLGLSEKPNPGSPGTTRWKASSSEPPWAVGSSSGSNTSRNSTIEPGQPWVMTSGAAPRCFERRWRKWMPSPSISVLNWSRSFRRFSRRRQS